MRDRGRNLDALVHRAGMQDWRFRPHARDTLLAQAPGLGVLADRGQQAGVLPLLLEPERDDAVGAIEGAVKVGLVGRAARRHAAAPGRRHQGGRSGERDRRAKRHERVDIRASHARVRDVANDDDALPGEIAERAAQRVRVEQALGGVGVPAVPGVDDRRVRALGHEVRSARGGVPHHDHVATEGRERADGVQQRLALLDGRAACGDVRDVRR